MSTENMNNQYSQLFVRFSILIVMSVLLLMAFMGGGKFGIIFFLFQRMIREGLIMIATPFVVPVVMLLRWALLKRDFTKKDFYCRVTGVMVMFIVYFYALYRILDIMASAPGAMIGLILYPISVPFVMPILYWIGYGVAWSIQKQEDNSSGDRE